MWAQILRGAQPRAARILTSVTRLLSSLSMAAALLAVSCTPKMLVGATATTSAALAASAANRASGGCWAMCTNGTTCNPRTGLCDEIPCRGLCGAGEHCEATYAESKCMPGAPSDVAAAARAADKTKLPVTPPQPPNLGGPPIIVPAAEQNPPSK
jgi:hypothetical protein